MSEGSIKLPHITEVAITKAAELLAFSTLPYYQASGNLLSGEGAVVIGEPIAWDDSVKKYIKYNPDVEDVVDEVLDYHGAGDSNDDGNTKVFVTAYGNIVPGSYEVKASFAFGENPEVKVENVDYWLDLKTGYLKFSECPTTNKDVSISYSWVKNACVAAGKCVGFVRIPGDSALADVAIEVLIGGAVKYSLVAVTDPGGNWSDNILEDLGAKYWEIADALIW